MADEVSLLNKRTYVATLSFDLVQHILAVGGPELLDLIAQTGGETITDVIDPAKFAAFLQRENHGYVYTQAANGLAFGGVSPAVVTYALENGGVADLQQIIKKLGKQTARATHADILGTYCKRKGIAYDDLAKQLGERATTLITVKDLGSSELERLAREMPKGGGTGGDEELLLAMETRLDELTARVEQLEPLEATYAALKAEYANTLAEIAGRVSSAALGPILERTVKALKSGSFSTKDRAELEKLRGEYETLRTLQTRTQSDLEAQRRDYGRLEATLRRTQDELTGTKGSVEEHKRKAKREAETLQGKVTSTTRAKEQMEAQFYEAQARYLAAHSRLEETNRQLQLVGTQLGLLLAPLGPFPATVFRPVVCKEEQELYLELVKRHHKRGRYDLLGTILTEGVEICEHHGKLTAYKAELINRWNEQGTAAQREGNHTDVRKYYRRIVELEPANLNAHLAIGLAYKAQDREADARTCYRQVIALQPEHLSAHLEMAGSYEREGKKGKARQLYQRVLTLDPDNTPAQTGLSRVR